MQTHRCLIMPMSHRMCWSGLKSVEISDTLIPGENFSIFKKYIYICIYISGLDGKESACHVGGPGLIPGS